MNKKIFKGIIFTIILISLSLGIQTSAKVLKEARVENRSKPEVKRRSPIMSEVLSPVMSTMSHLVATESIGPNLILNPSFILASSPSMPTGWNKGGYGTNTRQFIYLAPGNTDSRAAKIILSNYVNGDAKWYFNDVSVTPGNTYQFSDYSMSNVNSIITVRYKMTNGSFVYKDMATVPSGNTYRNTTFHVTVPADVVSLTVFHLINSNGNLTIDDASLNLVTTLQTTNNLIPNGDFETVGLIGVPAGWNKGGWGTNTRVFNYPVIGQTNSTGARVNITSYMSGDAKWYFTPIPITPGIYTYSDQIITNATSTITAQFQNHDGTMTYKDLVKIPPSPELSATSIDFSVGTEVATVTIYHLIQSLSSLTIDNVSIIKKADPVGIFITGAITLRFDDGWLSEYENAIPKMNSVGIKGTFYIVSKQKADDGYPAYMSVNQIREIYNMGHEIGSHTRTHPALSELTEIEKQNEIAGSRNDLLALNVGPILSLAYPYGDYDNSVLSIVKNAGFSSAVSTIDGYATQTSDKFQIERMGTVVSTTFSEIKQWIDNAQIQKKWLIISFHEINNEGRLYSLTPELFNQVIDYIVSKNIPVVTMSEGIESIE